MLKMIYRIPMFVAVAIYYIIKFSFNIILYAIRHPYFTVGAAIVCYLATKI